MTWDQIVDRLATASPWELAANVLVQTTLILAAGLLAGRLSRSGGAALQSLVYRTTLVAVLLCPLLAFGLKAAGFDRLVLDVEPYFQPEAPDPQIAVNRWPPATQSIRHRSNCHCHRKSMRTLI